MTEFENSEDELSTSEDLEVIQEFGRSKITSFDQLDARRKVEDLLEEKALKKLLDDELYYDFK